MNLTVARALYQYCFYNQQRILIAIPLTFIKCGLLLRPYIVMNKSLLLVPKIVMSLQYHYNETPCVCII